ncbi:topoisomerase II medium subunit [Xanthomonas phage XaC1]|nr:topoisomerase II medium subunit [Xanthomonas phage XaC1]
MAKKQEQKEYKITLLPKNSAEYVNDTSLEYSIYTLDRAIPSMIDGLKSAQRKALYIMSKINGEKKTVAIGGDMIASNIYLHGDSSANGTLSLMASPVANNIPLIQGVGFFGSVVETEAASPRYTYCKKNINTEKLIYPDINIVPMQDNYDGSTQEPSHFLPIIPTVLLNGVVGIAVGYKSTVLPYTIKDVVNNTLKAIDDKELSYMKPTFEGYGTNDLVDHNGEGKYTFYGKVKIIDGSSLKVVGLPPNLSLEKFVEKLIKMEEDGKIRDYENNSTDIVDIDIKLPRGASASWNEMDAIKYLNLSTSVTQSLVVLGSTGKVRTYGNDTSTMIKDFVKFRFTYYIKRYEKLLQDTMLELRYKLLIKECFDNNIPSQIKGFKNRAEMTQAINNLNAVIEATPANVDSIVAFASYRWTEEYYTDVLNEINTLVQNIGTYENMLKNESLIWDVYRSEVKDLLNVKFYTGR